MEEILPGIFHWTQAHPKIKIDVSSYYLQPERVLIDPLIPDEGLEWFAEYPPENIYMSIRHHYRHCGEFQDEYGCKVWCVEQGMHELTHGERVQPFHFGDTLPGNVEIGRSFPVDLPIAFNSQRRSTLSLPPLPTRRSTMNPLLTTRLADFG